MDIKRIFRQVAVILGLSFIVGLTVNIPLIKRYFDGEFFISFLPEEKNISMSYISLDEAQDYFSSGDVLFIDSRPQQNFQIGRIFGAINIPYDEYVNDYIKDRISVPLDKTLIVYCDGADCRTSVSLAKILAGKGFTEIRIFFGGWVEWLDAGLPVDTGSDFQ